MGRIGHKEAVMNDLISAAYSERLRRVCDHI
ncbi:AraC family transcriptional regulator, partial [Salmonella enterica]|nr:AraC family transcriptional regulator [Salmonella enterica]